MRQRLMIGLIAIVLGAAGAGLRQMHYVEESRQIQEGIASKIIRFHVLANSDSSADQQLKLKVRDRVIHYLENRMEQVTETEQARVMIQNELQQIVAESRKVLQENGCDCAVSAELKQVDFPEKIYDKVTLPAGIYEALQVRIGRAQGHNWWCVIYPGLCFVQDSCRVVTDEKLQKLSQVLTEEEYHVLTEPGSYRIGWKWF